MAAGLPERLRQVRARGGPAHQCQQQAPIGALARRSSTCARCLACWPVCRPWREARCPPTSSEKPRSTGACGTAARTCTRRSPRLSWRAQAAQGDDGPSVGAPWAAGAVLCATRTSGRAPAREVHKGVPSCNTSAVGSAPMPRCAAAHEVKAGVDSTPMPRPPPAARDQQRKELVAGVQHLRSQHDPIWLPLADQWPLSAARDRRAACAWGAGSRSEQSAAAAGQGRARGTLSGGQAQPGAGQWRRWWRSSSGKDGQCSSCRPRPRRRGSCGRASRGTPSGRCVL